MPHGSDSNKMTTKAFFKSRNQREKVEMRSAHLKTHDGFERLRLRGLSGVRDEFHLAPIVRNLKTMALRLLGQPPDTMCRQLRDCAVNNGAVVHRPPPNSWRDRLLPSSNH